MKKEAHNPPASGLLAIDPIMWVKIYHFKTNMAAPMTDTKQQKKKMPRPFNWKLACGIAKIQKIASPGWSLESWTAKLAFNIASVVF